MGEKGRLDVVRETYELARRTRDILHDTEVQLLWQRQELSRQLYGVDAAARDADRYIRDLETLVRELAIESVGDDHA